MCISRDNWVYALDNSRRNHLARTAPRRIAVQNHERVLLGHSLIELALVLENVNTLLGGHCSGEEAGLLWEKRLVGSVDSSCWWFEEAAASAGE